MNIITLIRWDILLFIAVVVETIAIIRLTLKLEKSGQAIKESNLYFKSIKKDFAMTKKYIKKFIDKFQNITEESVLIGDSPFGKISVKIGKMKRESYFNSPEFHAMKQEEKKEKWKK